MIIRNFIEGRGIMVFNKKLAFRAYYFFGLNVFIGSAILFAPVAFASIVDVADAPSAHININSEVKKQSLVVRIGKSAIVNLEHDAREIIVSDPESLQAILRSSRQLVFLGKKIGATNILFFDKTGKQFLTLDVQVEYDIEELNASIKKNYSTSKVKVETSAGRLILTGQVHSSKEAESIGNFAKSFLKSLVASSSNASSLDDDAIINRLSVTEEDQVMLKVKVAEVRRSVSKELGVNWSSLGGSSGATISGIFDGASSFFGISSGSAVASSSSLLLNTLESHSLVKLLAEPNLTAVSGETASMLAGGSFPIVTGSTYDADSNRYTILYEYKDIGVSLKFTPVVLGEGRISLKLGAEVSEFSDEDSMTVAAGDGETTEIPSISLRKTNTTVELPSGGTMAIAGLLRSEGKRLKEGVPIMQSIPILGALFRSENFQNKETELVILVTPYVVKHGKESDFKLPTDGFAFASDIDMYLFGSLTSTYGGNEQLNSAAPPPEIPSGFMLE